MSSDNQSSLDERKMVERLKEIFKTLKKTNNSPQDRTECYGALTSLVKEHTSSNPEFTALLCQHHNELTEKILGDITCKSCDHASLQVLGYCLHNPDFAAECTNQQVSRLLESLRGIITNESTDKILCTRALWCLANQSIASSQLISHVTSLVTVVSKVMMSQRCATATIESEALNFYSRFSQQFPAEFTAVAPVWYKTVIRILFCKVPKLQRRALFLAVSYEYVLRGNQEILQWLCKELKDHLVASMMSLMRERGQDYVHILNTWGHFISILGKALHKHGSFLNELLPVVETGFKHKSFVVQVAAYTAWKSLVSNFSLQLDLMTSPKRLKLLLMPLIASAVRDRHEHVEQARIQAWWHLIGCLGNQKEALFNQVCVPFLLLCLGLDPKSDLSQLSSQMTRLYSSDPHSMPRNENVTTPVSHSHSMKLSVTPTPGSSSRSNTSIALNASQDKSLNVSGQRGHFRTGSLVTLVCSPRTPRHEEKKNRDHYLKPPTVAMVTTGCHALLQFTGGRDGMEHSLIETDLKRYLVYPKFIVPLDVAQFLVLFLDGLFSFLSSHSDKEKLKNTNLVVHHILSLVSSTLKAHDAPSTSGDHSLISNILTSVLKMLDSGAFDDYLVIQAKRDILSQLCALPPRCVGVAERDTWKILVHMLLQTPKNELTSDWFFENWQKVLSIASSKFTTPDPLSNLLYLSNEFEEFAKSTEVERNTTLKMWSTLAKQFASTVTETSQINNGTVLEPDFRLVSHILKFPFHHILDQLDRNRVTMVIETWKSVYETSNRHIPLVVKDPNTCAQLVCSDLYAAYGRHLKSDSTSLDRRPNMIKFDLYQNAMATAVRYVTSKLNWSHCGRTEGQSSRKDRHGNAEGKDKCMQTLLSLVAWQLATFWDSTQKSPVSLSQLTTPYTLMDTVETLFTHLPTSDLIKQMTNMLAQPLATLWDAILSSCDDGSLSTRTRSTRTSSLPDLQDKVMSSWKSIMTCYQSRYKKAFSSDVLADISPLLIVTLNSPRQDFTKAALSFWTLTFDLSPQHLVYPPKLRDFFTRYLKETKSPLPLKLPGFNEPEPPSRDPSIKMDTTSTTSNVSPSITDSAYTDVQSQTSSTILLPNVSPRKGVLGSFLNRPPVASPIKPPSAPSSPGAKALNEVLSRSAKGETKSSTNTTAPVASTSMSPGRVGVVGSAKKGVGQSPALSVRRKLSLSGDEATYVSVAPPPKKPHLLTEHQKEKKRERAVLPAMYNALDPLSVNTQQYTVEDSMPEDEDAPIIIPESDVSPATPVSRPITQQSKQHYIPPASSTPFSKTTPTKVSTSKQHHRHDKSTYQQPVTVGNSPQKTPPPKPNPTHSINILRKPRKQSNDQPVCSSTAPCATPPRLISDSSTKSKTVTTVTNRQPVQARVIRAQSSDRTGQPLSPTDVAFSSGQTSSNNSFVFSSLYNQTMLDLRTSSKTIDASIISMLSRQIQDLQKQAGVTMGTTPPTVHTVNSRMHGQALANQQLSSLGLDTSCHPSQVSNTYQQRGIMVARPLPPQVPISHIQHQLSVGGVTRPTPGQVTMSYTIPGNSIPLPAQQVQLLTNIQPTFVTQPHPQQATSTIRDLLSDQHHGPNSTNKRPKHPVTKKARLSLKGRKQSTSDDIETVNNSASKGLNKEAPVESKGLKQDEEMKDSVSSLSKERTAAIVGPDGKQGNKKPRGQREEVSSNAATKPPMDDVIIIEDDVMETDEGTRGERGDKDEGTRKKGAVFDSEEDPLVGLSSTKPAKNVIESKNGHSVTSEAEAVMKDDVMVVEAPTGMPEHVCDSLDYQDKESQVSSSTSNHSNNDEQCREASHGEKEVSTPTSCDAKKTSVESGTNSPSSIAVNVDEPVDNPIPKSDSHSTTTGSDSNESLSKEDHSSTAVDQSKSVATTTDSVSSKISVNVDTSPVADNNQEPAEKATPIGILKHVSQFDTPATGRGGRRVQFASNPTFHSRGEEGNENFKTPKHGTSRVQRTPTSAFSSRRTLLLSQTPPKTILVSKPHPQTPPTQETGPVYPNLMDCSLPVGQILPALSSSKFTHGLLQLVKARNISTVGDISGLSEQQVQTLPIKSPKVASLRDALRKVEKQQQGVKRKSSIDETSLAPPKKQLKLTSDSDTAIASSEAPPTTSNDHTHKPANDASTSEDSEVFSEVLSVNEPSITVATPDSQTTPTDETSDKALNEEAEPAQQDPTHSNECSTNISTNTSSDEQQHTDTSNSTTVVSAVSHDHSYCSHDLGSPSKATSATTNESSTVAISNNKLSVKLSFANNDHTYCSPVKSSMDDIHTSETKVVGVASSKQEGGVASKEDGQSLVTVSMEVDFKEQVTEISDEPTSSEPPVNDDGNDGDTSVSQELFSFDQSQVEESHDQLPESHELHDQVNKPPEELSESRDESHDQVNKPHDQLPESRDESHDQVNKPHDQLPESRDESHDQVNKPHDQLPESRDESHDQVNKPHDQLPESRDESHDQVNKPHDQLPESRDESHDQVNKPHDQLPESRDESHDQVNKPHDQLPESHDKSHDQVNKSHDHPQEVPPLTDTTNDNEPAAPSPPVSPPTQPMEVTTTPSTSEDTSVSDNPKHIAECSQHPLTQEEQDKNSDDVSYPSATRNSDQSDEREVTNENSKSEPSSDDFCASLERWLAVCEDQFDGLGSSLQLKMVEEVQRVSLRAQQVALEFTRRMSSKVTEDSS